MMATVSERIVTTFKCDPCAVRYILTGSARAYADLFTLQLEHALCEAR